ncbi:MAG: hypothetical protein K1X31_10120 [Gemmatimonadaceae bacterium]|nr:hypothetical protein [Gemmatimonadaceae bacterium]
MPLLRPTMVLSQMDLEEPTFVRRLSMNVLAMAVLTGGSLRVYRALILQFGWSNSWLWIAGTFLGGAAILFLLATLHLGNYPVRAWLWRAPLFAVLEAATEILVSLALTSAGLERIGSLIATLEDWQGSAMRLAAVRVSGLLLFTLVLAFVSTVVRLLIVPRRPKRRTTTTVVPPVVPPADPPPPPETP